MNRPVLSHTPEPIRLTNERLRLLIFAEPKVGKTTLAMTFPRPLVIDTDGGLVSVTVERPGEELGDSWVPTGHKDLEGLYWWIKEHADGHDTIVIDSGPELIFLLMEELVVAGAEYDRSKRKEAHPVTEFVPEQAEYLANQRQMHAFLTALKRLNKHIVITSGVREDKVGKRTADFAPGLLKIVAHWASVIGELVVVDEGPQAGSRVLITQPSNARQVGSRFRALTPAVVNPTFDSLWGPVEESLRKGSTGDKS